MARPQRKNLLTEEELRFLVVTGASRDLDPSRRSFYAAQLALFECSDPTQAAELVEKFKAECRRLMSAVELPTPKRT